MNTSDTLFKRNKAQAVLWAALYVAFYLSRHIVLSTTLFLVLAGQMVWTFIDISRNVKPKSTVLQTVIALSTQLVILGLLFLMAWYFLEYKVKPV